MPAACTVLPLTQGGSFLLEERAPAEIFTAEDLSEQHLAIARTVDEFWGREVEPNLPAIRRQEPGVVRCVLQKAAAIGLTAIGIPEEFGGMELDLASEVIATERLGRDGSYSGWHSGHTGIGTLPVLYFGTEEQKQEWVVPAIKGTKILCIGITEPDAGSDVAGIVTAAAPVEGGWVVNGVKTWCTFAARADVFMLLARTNPDPAAGHRGLSMFIVPKPRGAGHGFAFTQDGRPGRLSGRAIDTLGYRGMHSYEVAFDDWFVPAANLVGGEGGLGRGFYLQMAGFENGRLQTAARAVGLMQAAFEAGLAYAQERNVFGAAVFDYQLSKAKLARMAALIQAGRQFSFDVARKMAGGQGTLEASMVKAYVCRAAEWVTREAMQLHGGMGYAEEFTVSRLFVDARVLSIFEGADETLCLRVIARRLAENALA